MLMHQEEVLIGVLVQQSQMVKDFHHYAPSGDTRCCDRVSPGRLWGLVRCDLYSLLIIKKQSLQQQHHQSAPHGRGASSFKKEYCEVIQLGQSPWQEMLLLSTDTQPWRNTFEGQMCSDLTGQGAYGRRQMHSGGHAEGRSSEPRVIREKLTQFSMARNA